MSLDLESTGFNHEYSGGNRVSDLTLARPNGKPMTETETCSHPTCYESEKSATLYKEPTDHNDRGWFAVCGQHADMSKEITVLMSEHAGPAQIANSEILAELKR